MSCGDRAVADFRRVHGRLQRQLQASPVGSSPSKGVFERSFSVLLNLISDNSSIIEAYILQDGHSLSRAGAASLLMQNLPLPSRRPNLLQAKEAQRPRRRKSKRLRLSNISSNMDMVLRIGRFGKMFVLASASLDSNR